MAPQVQKLNLMKTGPGLENRIQPTYTQRHMKKQTHVTASIQHATHPGLLALSVVRTPYTPSCSVCEQAHPSWLGGSAKGGTCIRTQRDVCALLGAAHSKPRKTTDTPGDHGSGRGSQRPTRSVRPVHTFPPKSTCTHIPGQCTPDQCENTPTDPHGNCCIASGCFLIPER